MPDTPKDPDFSDVSGGSSSTASQTYVVAKGDSLSKIAKKFYGDAKLWHVIHEANKDRIKNPDMIQIGWSLTIPPKP